LDLPVMRVSPIELTHRGLSINIPGSVEFDKQVNITFLESGPKILKFFDAWRAMVGKISLPLSYSQDGSLDSIKGSYSVSLLKRNLSTAFTIVFEGVFPLSIELGQAVGDKGADILRPVVSFSYDYFYFS